MNLSIILIISMIEYIYSCIIMNASVANRREKWKSIFISITIEYILNRFPIYYLWIKRYPSVTLYFIALHLSRIALQCQTKTKRRNLSLWWSPSSYYHIYKHVCKTLKKRKEKISNQNWHCLQRLIYIFWKKKSSFLH